MYQLFVQEILAGEGESGVALIDTQWDILIVHTDKWNRYASNIPNNDHAIGELRDCLEAVGFIVVTYNHVPAEKVLLWRNP